MTDRIRHRQSGMTVLGFLILAALVGVVGLAVLKVTPMYLKRMRMNQVLEDVQTELQGQAASPTVIRNEVGKRFAIEDIRLSTNAVKITQSRDGYTVKIEYEERAPYLAGIFLVLVYDKQVEIRR